MGVLEVGSAELAGGARVAGMDGDAEVARGALGAEEAGIANMGGGSNVG